MLDLLVVGGGPAGLATAIFGASAGLSVALVERGRFPRDKACGEGLMPRGVEALARMGVRPRRTRPFDGIRYVDGELAAEARFARGGGLGIRRLDLSEAMSRRARELGVGMREEERVVSVRVGSDRVVARTSRDELRARFLAAADGLRSPIRAELGLEARSSFPRAKRYGFRRHFRVAPWSRFVEVHWTEGCEAYVTPVGEDEVGVALLWRDGASSYEAMLARFPYLVEKLSGAPVVTAVKAAGPFRTKTRRVTAGPIALVGDAAGSLDAITGEGVSLGIRSAGALVESLMAHGSLKGYERRYRQLSRRYYAMTELVLLLASHPRLRRQVIRVFARRPRLFERMLALSTGSESNRIPVSTIQEVSR